jgi:hypothetical protein
VTSSFLPPSPRGLNGFARPVGPPKPPRDLTSATDARTTRLRRPRRLSKKPLDGLGTSPAEVFAKAVQRRRLARSMIAHGVTRPARSSRPTLPRPPHPVPTSVTIASAPHAGRDGVDETSDLGVESRGFLKIRSRAGAAHRRDGQNQLVLPCDMSGAAAVARLSARDWTTTNLGRSRISFLA